MPLTIGKPAPDFNLPSLHNGTMELIRLEDMLGENIVLLFYPFADTGGCTREMCTVTEDWSSYESLGARIFGVSTDSPHAQNLWREREGIRVPMLSDWNRTMVRDYDLVDDDFLILGNVMEGVADRAVVVIDRDGTIAYVERLAHPGLQPDLDRLKTLLAQLR